MSLVSQLDRDHVMFWFTIHYTVPDFTVTVDALLHKTDGYGTLIEWMNRREKRLLVLTLTV